MFLLLLAAVLLDVDELIHALYGTGRRHVRAQESEKAAWDPRELSTPYIEPGSSHITTQLETESKPLPAADKDSMLKELKHSAGNLLAKNLLKLRIGGVFFPFS